MFLALNPNLNNSAIKLLKSSSSREANCLQLQSLLYKKDGKKNTVRQIQGEQRIFQMCRLKSEQLWTFLAKESWLEDALASALGAWMGLSPEMGSAVCPSVISQDCVVKIEANTSLRRWGFGCRQQ